MIKEKIKRIGERINRAIEEPILEPPDERVPL